MNFYKTQDRPDPVFFAKGKRNDYFSTVTKTFMGRDALRIFLYNIKPCKVLIPAYTCQEITNEFLKSNCEIFYYDINPDFTIDTLKIIETIKTNGIELFYFIIYFGMANRNNTISSSIKNSCPDVIIVEDRAQYLSNKYDLNNIDAYIYSFRKLLPISEGGGILSKRPLNIDFSKKIQANILPFLMYIKKKLLGYNDKYNRTSLTKKDLHHSIMPISKHSQKVLERYDYDSEIEFRRKCYREWIKKLKKSNIRPVFESIENGDIPHGCPICVDDSTQVHEYMRQKKYYLRRHWKLKDDMSAIAPVSYSISNKIITLPIYRGINEKIQNDIIKLLQEYKSIN